MKVTVNKIDALKRELKFEIPRERVSKKMEDVYTEIGKVAKVRGFRPGKAPRHILEVEHGTLAKEETLKKLIPEVYQEGLVQEKIDPLDMPEIHDVSFKDGTISFTAHLEVQPEITVKKYKGITVKRKSNQVTDEEIHKTLAYFKTSQGEGKETAIDDNFAKGLGYPGLEIFKQSLVRQMEIDKDRQNRADVENQIIDAVLHESRFVIPQSMVNKLLEKRLEAARKHFRSHGKPEKELQDKEPEMRKELQSVAERDVKVYLVFNKIAELEGISGAENETLIQKVMEFLLKEANWQ